MDDPRGDQRSGERHDDEHERRAALMVGAGARLGAHPRPALVIHD